MPSSLTWIDYDSSERSRVHRILALLKQRNTVDELGIGNIRDSIAEQLFPGTSTIQTRLRYFLFVPWMYRELEDRRTSPERMPNAEREYQLRLMDGLLETDDLAGVFGVVAGKRIKRLPSSVYWSGLGTWKIRQFDGSQEDYYGELPNLYRRRSARTRSDDTSANEGASDAIWHADVPDVPEGFPDKASLTLTRDEASFIRDRIVVRWEKTLLANLALREDHAAPTADAPWQHPNLADFDHDHRVLLEHARLFADLMRGAAILYNLLLARLANREELTKEHTEGLNNWRDHLPLGELSRWKLSDLWASVIREEFRITETTLKFVSVWYELVLANPGNLASSDAAEQLIRKREYQLKRDRSRFQNRRALDQFGGYAGLRPLVYRWNIVSRLLDDLYRGLHAHDDA